MRTKADIAKYKAEWDRRKKADPAYLAADRAKRQAAQAARRAKLRANPEAHRTYLQQRQQRRTGYMKEAKVEAYLREQVLARKGMCPKFLDPARRGAPDRLVLLPGHPTYYVELKRPVGGVLEPHQERYHRDIRATGQRVWVLRSTDEVDAFFGELALCATLEGKR